MSCSFSIPIALAPFHLHTSPSFSLTIPSSSSPPSSLLLALSAFFRSCHDICSSSRPFFTFVYHFALISLYFFSSQPFFHFNGGLHIYRPFPSLHFTFSHFSFTYSSSPSSRSEKRNKAHYTHVSESSSLLTVFTPPYDNNPSQRHL